MIPFSPPSRTDPESHLPASRVGDAIRHWRDARPSYPVHHAADCCVRALSWLRALHAGRGSVLARAPSGDGSRAGAASRPPGVDPSGVDDAPRWLSDRYAWGPCRWPASWCEIVRREVVDCGAFAALARACFAAEGRAVYPVQLIQHYPEHQIEHWRRRWVDSGVGTDWIRAPFVYHEACAVPASCPPEANAQAITDTGPNAGSDAESVGSTAGLLATGAGIEIWDPSRGAWLHPTPADRVVALQVRTADGTPAEAASWHGVSVPLNRWTRI